MPDYTVPAECTSIGQESSHLRALFAGAGRTVTAAAVALQRAEIAAQQGVRISDGVNKLLRAALARSAGLTGINDWGCSDTLSAGSIPALADGARLSNGRMGLKLTDRFPCSRSAGEPRGKSNDPRRQSKQVKLEQALQKAARASSSEGTTAPESRFWTLEATHEARWS